MDALQTMLLLRAVTMTVQSNHCNRGHAATRQKTFRNVDAEGPARSFKNSLRDVAMEARHTRNIRRAPLLSMLGHCIRKL